MPRTSPAIASLAAHREAVDEHAAARRSAQAMSFIVLELLEIEVDIRALDATIAEYEELLARLCDDQPYKPGRHRLQIGTLKIDLVLSSKPQLRELVSTLKARRQTLADAESARRLAAAHGVADALRRHDTAPSDGLDPDEPPPSDDRETPNPPAIKVANGATPWG